MRICYSGNGRSAAIGPRNCDPENVLANSDLMLTYAQCGVIDNNQTPRLKALKELRMLKRKGETDNTKVNVLSHFLDSGSFSLKSVAKKYAKENKCSEWDYYDTDQHWKYLDAYANFVIKHKVAIDLYANVDAIPDPDLTWRNQKYLENKHGLNPVPVVHYGTDLDWLSFYVKRNKHEVIAIGSLGGGKGKGKTREDFINWLDKAFNLICPPPSRLPVVKLHGFAVTSFDVMRRYPWWSVDSATWTKIGAFGGVIIPHRRKGKWVYDEAPYTLWFTEESPMGEDKGKHFDTITDAERRIVLDWLEEIAVPLGEGKEGEETRVLGVRNHHSERKIANLLYFERFRLSLPEWPWAFKPPMTRKGFGLK